MIITSRIRHNHLIIKLEAENEAEKYLSNETYKAIVLKERSKHEGIYNVKEESILRTGYKTATVAFPIKPMTEEDKYVECIKAYYNI